MAAITAQEIITEIKSALKQFGEYSYQDKGAREVMEIIPIVNRLKELPSANILAVLTEVEQSPVNAGPFLQDCIGSFDDWEDPRCEELFESELFQEWY